METNTMAYREKDDDSLVIYDDDDVLAGVERAPVACMFMKGLIVFDLEKPVRKGTNLGNINDEIRWVDFRKVDFKSKELGPWLRAESVGKRVAWSISSNASQGFKNSVEERKIGVVRKIDSDDLLKILERMTMCEKKNDRVPTSLSNGGEEVMYTQSKIGKEEGLMVMKEVGVIEVKKGVEGYEGGTLHREEDVKGDSEKGIGSKTFKGGVKKWKRVAREKENVVPWWVDKFPNFKVSHLIGGSSDHLPIMMDSDYKLRASHRRKENFFRFEQMLTMHNECEGLIRESWEEGRYMGGTGVEGSLEMLKESLTQWNKKVFENVNHRIRKLQEELQKLYKVPDGRLNIEKGLQDNSGVWREEIEEKGVIVVHYFQDLFTTSGPTSYEEVTNHVPKKLPDEIMNTLDENFTMEEDVLRMGLLRLVGDGDATKIFGDPWVLGVENMTLHPRPGGLDFNANVSLLLDVTGRWRMDVLRQNFSEDEVSAILKLLQHTRRSEDQWSWSLTTHGGFTVKSAYHAIHNATQEQATDMEYGHVWSRIWKMKTLPSTKLFIWRAVKNILPTGDALSRRGMDVDGACIICKMEAETRFHAVIGCEDAQRFWKTTNLPFVDERNDETDFKEWMNAAVVQWAPKELDLFAMAAQKLWERRNKIRIGHSERKQEMATSIFEILEA
ncbi:putative ribonuclease H-like domain, reverse transcriptase zinc-binding domain-containing protein [Senna tora]|uniref:Putative ribonuclease H-like domain, reverse transcriptase zinc-binding domain-containing protein n=1 Tax=Senna tora TaxID=362788 RepID=A0A834W1F3_9FABA|nr:putative ribonuclease H-like domain, reverse transcriptase zinc-binding domain-containing protein [Senna tora]